MGIFVGLCRVCGISCLWKGIKGISKVLDKGKNSREITIGISKISQEEKANRMTGYDVRLS